MKVMILPTSTGQGHNSASKALKERLGGLGIDAFILDVLNSGKKEKSRLVSGCYNAAVNYVPLLFGAAYRLGELISSSRRHSPIYYLNSLYSDALNEKISELKPDVIVCPHMFSAHAITRLVDKRGLKIPSVGIITDYTCSPFWEETTLTAYVTANEKISDECVSKGMNRDALYALGIPVSEKFKKKRSKREAREAFGITKEKVFLVMGGSMGYGKIPEITAKLLERAPGAQVIAACGTNAKAYDRVEALPGATPLRFIDNIDLLMDAADVLITKPGGLSTTEALTKRIPLVISLPIPGGETKNSDFIAGTGMAISANSVAKATSAAIALMSDTDAREKMIAAQKKYCNINATEDVCRLIMKLADSAR